jgi:hypothetical protein
MDFPRVGDEVEPVLGGPGPAGIMPRGFNVCPGNRRVVRLPAGSASQVVLPFTGLNEPDGVAADSADAVHVADFGNNLVVKLPPQ